MDFVVKIYNNGIEVIDSYKVFWDRETINRIYPSREYVILYKTDPSVPIKWSRSKFSLYVEWFIHTLCYKLGYQRERAKDVYFEFNGMWFKNLFK